MAIKMFVRQCPTCELPDKVVMRCHGCKKWVCSVCSINGLCIDCHAEVDLIIKKEVRAYFEDKYVGTIIT